MPDPQVTDEMIDAFTNGYMEHLIGPGGGLADKFRAGLAAVFAQMTGSGAYRIDRLCQATWKQGSIHPSHRCVSVAGHPYPWCKCQCDAMSRSARTEMASPMPDAEHGGTE